MPSPPPSTTLPLGQRWSDQPEGEIRDEANLPLRMKLANKILDIMGMPEPGGPSERMIAPMLSLGLTAAPMVKPTVAAVKALPGMLAETNVVKGAKMGWDPMSPGGGRGRPPPSPHPIVEKIARRFVDPEDERLYQMFLEQARKENAALENQLPKSSMPSLEEPRQVYGNALSDVAAVRDDLRKAQMQARWHEKNRATPIDYEAGSGEVFPLKEPNAPEHLMEVRHRPEFKGWRPPDSPPLVLTDHGLQAMKDYYGGTPLSSQALRVLAYNAAKGVAQGAEKVAPSYAPKVEDWLLRRAGTVSDLGLSAGTLTQATPPSLKSIMWGLRPFWARD